MYEFITYLLALNKYSDPHWKWQGLEKKQQFSTDERAQIEEFLGNSGAKIDMVKPDA